jgi:hypothetical protein
LLPVVQVAEPRLVPFVRVKATVTPAFATFAPVLVFLMVTVTAARQLLKPVVSELSAVALMEERGAAVVVVVGAAVVVVVGAAVVVVVGAVVVVVVVGAAVVVVDPPGSEVPVGAPPFALGSEPMRLLVVS